MSSYMSRYQCVLLYMVAWRVFLFIYNNIPRTVMNCAFVKQQVVVEYDTAKRGIPVFAVAFGLPINGHL